MNLALTYSFLAEDALHVPFQIECHWLETDEGYEYDHHPHDGKKGLLDFVIYGGICRSSPGCKRPNLGSDAQGRSRRTVLLSLLTQGDIVFQGTLLQIPRMRSAIGGQHAAGSAVLPQRERSIR